MSGLREGGILERGTYVIHRFDLVIFEHIATYSGTFKAHEVADMVYDYNQNLEPDEETMSMSEMIGILQQKGVIDGTERSFG